MLDPIIRLNGALQERYRVERELGEGGMATVYLAVDLRHERRVALKVLKPELAAVLGAERFLAEIKTTAQLQHPNILPLHDSGEADGLLFYVMPLVEGESLRERLDRERQLPVDEAVKLASETAEALDYAHRRGVVHRDIKPANILMQDGKPVISDFGIALALGTAGRGRLTETGLSLGTPHYMSPEQATGDLSVGPATDVYALGCVLFEMLVGEPPYTGSTPQAVLGKIVTGEPPRVRAQRSTVPAHVDAVIRRALEKVPADRFGAAGEMARALGDPTFQWGAAAVATGGRIAALWNPLSAILAVALVVVAAGWAWNGTGRGGEGVPVRRSSLLLPDGRSVSGRTSSPLSISDDGSRVAFRVLSEDGTGEVYVRELAQSAPVRLPAVGDGEGSIALSPDGAWVAFHDAATRQIKRAPTTGGPAETIGPTGLTQTAGFGGLRYGADGSLVYSTRLGLRRLAAAGGTPEILTSLEPDDPLGHRDPVFLPDGSGIVFTELDARSTEQRLLVHRFGGDGPEELTEGHSAHVTADGILLYGRGGYNNRTLSAARLSADWSAVEGDPITVLEGILEMQVAPETPSLRYAVSRDGTLVHLPVLATPVRRYLWADRAGNQELLLAQDDPRFPPGITSLGPARVSPDGSRIAFRAFYGESDPDGQFRLFTYDLERGFLTPVSVARNADWPVWSADGARVAFNRFFREDQNLYWTRVDNTVQPEPLIAPNTHQQHAQEFSRDGTFLIYTQRDEPNTSDYDLWLLPLDGSGEPRNILDGAGHQRNASISPDGRWLAYQSDASGQDEVYVTELPEPRTFTRISASLGRTPVWSPSGEELLYVRPGDPVSVVAVPISTAGGRVEVGSPQILVEGAFAAGGSYGRTLDVHPDGERLLLYWFGDETLDVPRIELIQGFDSYVWERLGPR